VGVASRTFSAWAGAVPDHEALASVLAQSNGNWGAFPCSRQLRVFKIQAALLGLCCVHQQAVCLLVHISQAHATIIMLNPTLNYTLTHTLAGFNVCIFAYGQTGSGKTHTMSGTDIADYSGRGINYRALDDLFQLRDDRSSEVMTRVAC